MMLLRYACVAVLLLGVMTATVKAHYMEEEEIQQTDEPSFVEVQAQYGDSMGVPSFLYWDAANPFPAIRAPYLAATLPGPLYARTGPQSEAAKSWLAQGSEPGWSVLPFGPRTNVHPYTLPFAKFKEVHDEFSFLGPAPQLSVAAPIFLEQRSTSRSTQMLDAELVDSLDQQNEQQNENENENESENEIIMHAKGELSDDESSPSFVEISPNPAIPVDFWAARPPPFAWAAGYSHGHPFAGWNWGANSYVGLQHGGPSVYTPFNSFSPIPVPVSPYAPIWALHTPYGASHYTPGLAHFFTPSMLGERVGSNSPEALGA